MTYYAEAELYLIRLIADAAARTGNAPNWAEASLLEVRRMRRAVHQLNTQMARDVPDLLIDAVDQAYTTGRVDAETELQKIKSEALPPSAIDHQAVVSLTRPGLESLAPVHQHLARNVENVWSVVTREVASQSVIGVKTTRQATQDAMNRLAREGMGFYRDKAGRRWGLDTYSEMAVRSTTNNALRAGHSSRLIEAGYDLVIVSSHKNPAPQCAPFERKVLSLTGGTPSGTQVVEGEIVNVVASMSEAEAAGLHHVNCRHTHSLFQPGVTPLEEPEPDPGHEGYKATQRQRYLERQVRASKRLEAAALDEEAARKARARARHYQGELREHVEKWGLPRRRHREQLRTPKIG